MLAHRDTRLRGLWPALATLALCACATTTDASGSPATEPDGGSTGDATDVDGAADDASPELEDSACEDLQSHRYQTCLIDPWSDEDADVSEDAVYEMELTGTVEAIEEDVRCTGVGNASRSSLGYGVRVVGDGEGATLGFTLPFTQALFKVGETIHVKYQRGPEPFASEGLPPTGSVVIRDTEGELLYWIAETFNGFDDLDVPPELTISEGSTSCSYTSGSCDKATRSSLIVDVGAGLIDVPYGAMHDVGDFVLLHADNERHESPGDTVCTLAHHHISIAAARGSLISLGLDHGTSF